MLLATKVSFLQPKQAFHFFLKNEKMYQIIKSIFIPLNNEFMFYKLYYDTLTIQKKLFLYTRIFSKIHVIDVQY